MKPKREYRARDQVWVRVGKERIRATVVAALDPELHTGVYRVQAQDGAFLDAHRCQMKPYRGPKTVFCAIFEAPTINPEGLSLPRETMDAVVSLADKGLKIIGVAEYKEVKRYRLEDIPKRPAFLEPKTER